MLKQLKLTSELKSLRNELDGITVLQNGFNERKSQLEKSLTEATTDEDISFVRSAVDALEKEVTESNVAEREKKITEEINRIETELEEIKERDDATSDKNNIEVPDEAPAEERGKKMATRQQPQSYYERSDVKEFYESFKNLRKITGEGLTVPQVVVNRITDIIGDYCTLYPLVDKIKANGTTRILIDTDTTPATWIEQNGEIAVGDIGTIADISFDGYKIGKATFVDNSMLQDSIINLDDYVTKKLARAIALGLDNAILNGEGAAKKQPEGIITKLPSDRKLTVDASKLINIVKPIGMIDTGKDAVGEIVSVMKRSTYYNRVLEYTIQTTSNGDVVGKLPNIAQPNLLGIRVVYNEKMADDAILYGDFSKYTMIDRENITITNSEHFKFLSDQTAFLGKGRFDGKPTKINAFVLVTLTDANP